MAQRSTLADYRAPVPRPTPAANQTVRDKARDKGRRETAPVPPPARSTHHARAWCHRSSNTCPHTIKFPKHTSAETPAPASPAEDLPRRQPRVPQLATPAAPPRSTAQTPPTTKHTIRAVEKSGPATARRVPPTTTRCNEFAAPARITKHSCHESATKHPCHSERASREESAVRAVTTKLRTNSTISAV